MSKSFFPTFMYPSFWQRQAALWQCLILMVVVVAVSLTLYHHTVLRPHHVQVADFRLLSEAKLMQLVERTTQGGSAVSANELQDFLYDLELALIWESGGRVVYASGAVLNADEDLTLRLAEHLDLQLPAASNGATPGLPSMANRVERQMRFAQRQSDALRSALRTQSGDTAPAEPPLPFQPSSGR